MQSYTASPTDKTACSAFMIILTTRLPEVIRQAAQFAEKFVSLSGFDVTYSMNGNL